MFFKSCNINNEIVHNHSFAHTQIHGNKRAQTDSDDSCSCTSAPPPWISLLNNAHDQPAAVNQNLNSAIADADSITRNSYL